MRNVRHLLLAVTVVIGTLGAAGALHTGERSGNGGEWTLAVVAVGNAALGWFVVGKRPGLSTGWLLLAGGLFGSVVMTATWWSGQLLDGDAPAGAGVAAWLALTFSSTPTFIAWVLPIATMPDGVPRNRRWRRFVVAVTALYGALVLAVAIVAGTVAFESPRDLTDVPGGVDGARAEWAIGLDAIARLVVFMALVVSLVGVAVARRRAEGDRRRQLSLVLAGAAVFVGTLVALGLIAGLSGGRIVVSEQIPVLPWLAIPTAIAIAVARYGLYDLRLLLSRSVLAVTVGVTLTAVYLAVLALVASVLDDAVNVDAANVVAAGVVAMVCVPVVATVKRRVTRWLGRGVTTLTLAEGLHDVTADQPPLEELATLIAGELRLGWVELTAGDLAPARIGALDGPRHNFTLRHANRDVGEMHICARGEALGASDLRTLNETARFVAVAMDAIRANDELRISRAELDRAHRDERRRVRRDLHDGLGPTLASIRLRLARRHDGAIDATALDDIFEQVTDAIREVRRIVDGLQPSILEDLGLVPAIQILVNDVRDTTGLNITFETSGTPIECSTDVAAAVYRSVAEALTNVARHSRATTCTVRLRVDADGVDVDVVDNGRGFLPPANPGMGLRSMLDRTTALGGTVDVDSGPGDGTRVAIRLPT